ncbi:MAG: orotidine-5'-phosphate decarboxylase [Burkholderiales bacterium]|jgi:orotidine-5'-phosphate decarboxylase|nr:orotidine-5'-phosphate decarboxylase [Burkholderiales bacterium]
MKNITDKLNARIEKTHSLVCVGLDSDYARLSRAWMDDEMPQFAFNRAIIDQTLDFACAYKINSAFYESRGAEGWEAMRRTMEYLRQLAPDVVTIIDAKRADIGNTSDQYATAFYDALHADAVTLHPWLGGEALRPFLKRSDKAAIILCHTSNAGSGEFQDLMVEDNHERLPMWRKVARNVAQDWNGQNNCWLVVGATVPQVLRDVRGEVGDMPILVPGVGAQGGDLAAVCENGLTLDKKGLMINASRSIIFADHPQQEAAALRDAINRYR